MAEIIRVEHQSTGDQEWLLVTERHYGVRYQPMRAWGDTFPTMVRVSGYEDVTRELRDPDEIARFLRLQAVRHDA